MVNICKKILAVLICVIETNFSFAQLTVNGSVTPTFLVQNVLLGPGVTASGITYTGSVLTRGSFGGSSNIGFASGVLLTSGNLVDAIGPNNTSSISVNNALPGDPDLDQIMSPTLSYDATILEFDFVAQSDSVKFNYVFGSDEYMEYVSTTPGGINDGFGFFISGPGISGPFSSSAINIALVPGTTLPVTMFNLNLMNNGAYYFDNGDGFGTGTAPDGATIQYDGFTVPLTARALLQCGETYHIKLAVADGGDGIIDSGVFLEEGSFTSPLVEINPTTNYSGGNDSTFYEGCGQVCIYFIRHANLGIAETLTLTAGGTATSGVDYAGLPGTLNFAVGQDSLVICVDAVDDASTTGTEGPETIIINISQTIGSCAPIISTQTLYITEFQSFTLSIGNDTTLCNSGGILTLNTTPSGGVPPYTFTWTNGAAPIEDPVMNVGSTTTFIVTADDACLGSTTDPTPTIIDSITVTVQTFAPMVVTTDNITTCPGDFIQLNVEITGGGSPYTYLWSIMSGTDSLTAATSATPSVYANFGGTYQIMVTDICGNTQSDLLSVFVEQSCALNIPNIITPDGQGPIQNEFFFVENLDKFPGSSLKIYSRWGNKIYETADYQNNWSGGGHEEGTYYYVLTVPTSGKVKASPNKPSTDGGSFKGTGDDATKVFAGFFQVSTLK